MNGTQLGAAGVSGALGFCAGYATKRLGLMVAFVGGVAFVGLQALQYYGIVSVDYAKAQKMFVSLFDQDGDGELTANDVRIARERLQRRLSVGLPSAVSFGAGFVAGLAF